MIKLNNKNITYVALADSSNSIKAPKEIWYADSNNSVKLVYRRKDALIEGEDYEKYHWLVGDADAYINTLKYYRPYDDSVQMTFRDNLYPNRETKYNKYNVEEQIWGACGNNYVQSIIRSYIAGTQQQRIANNIINATPTDGDVNWATYNTQSNINESSEHSLYISSVNDEDEYYFIHNGNTKDNLPTRYTLPELVQQDVRIFRSGLLSEDYFNGSFFNFIHYRNNVEITHLIPCKLLKPVPKWLDANGIRRNIGECGMIDLVSGKFYGNVNSNGTFTVENYYERKEWLVGDGSAYIDTGHNVNEDLDYETKAHLLPSTYLFWYRSGRPYTDMTMVVRSNNPSLYTGPRVAKNSTDVRINDIANVDVEWNGNEVSINGIDYTPSNKAITFDYELYLFYAYLNDVPNIQGEYTSNNVKCAYFRFLDSNRNYIQNLIPCTLTINLPASMDANNIARTKGTSGMWDLVSDRFYGNVANSGTFKAVNLAEGVDYEVHQWLVGDGSAYIDVQGYSRNENWEITTKTKLRVSNDWILLYGVGYVENTFTQGVWTAFGSADATRIKYRTSNGTSYKDNGINNIGNQVVSIVDTHTQMYFNDTLITAIQNRTYAQCNEFYIFAQYYTNLSTTNKAANADFSEFTVKESGTKILNLIPVKLLRPIPAKYDANGIARQVGECGMYDTVKDVFYGNVASSGTFSVEDN